jgi:hypothetical protein
VEPITDVRYGSWRAEKRFVPDSAYVQRSVLETGTGSAANWHWFSGDNILMNIT